MIKTVSNIETISVNEDPSNFLNWFEVHIDFEGDLVFTDGETEFYVPADDISDFISALVTMTS